MDTQSLLLWKGVLETNSYSTYNDCKETLSTLTASEYWKSLVQSTPTNKIIDLGVGAGDKDYEILNSFTELCSEKETVLLVLIDTSLVMLDVTLAELRRLANNLIKERRKKINIQGIRADFMKAGTLKSFLDEGVGKNIYFLLGGTFSNIDERSFMRDFANVTNPGDILIVSAEMYDDNDPDKSMENVKKSYSADSILKFAEIPIKSHLKDQVQMIGNVVIDSVAGPRFSDVPDARTLLFYTKIGDDNVKIISTSRYKYSSVRTFLEGFDFKIKEVIECPSNNNYKYFCLERQS